MSLHNLSWLALCRVILALTTILNLTLATRILGPQEYGLMGLTLALNSFVALFFVSPGGQLLTKNLFTWWRQGSLFSRLKRFSVYVVVIALASAFFIVIYWQLNGLKNPLQSAAIVLFLLLANTWHASLVPALNILGWPRMSASLLVVNACLGLIASLILSQISVDANHWLCGQIMGLGISAAFAHGYLWSKRKADSKSSDHVFMNRKDLWEFCAPLALGAGLMWVQWNSWRPIAHSEIGLTILGTMLAGYMLANYFWVVMEGISQQVLHPFFFAKKDAIVGESKKAYQNFVLILAPAYIYFAAFTMSLAPFINLILPKEQFSQASVYFLWGANIELARVLIGLLSHTVQMHGQARILLMPYVKGIGVAVFSLFVVRAADMINASTLLLTVVAGAVTIMMSIWQTNKRMGLGFDGVDQLFRRFFLLPVTCLACVCVASVIQTLFLIDGASYVISFLIWILIVYFFNKSWPQIKNCYVALSANEAKL
jgi:O-antigen/teichoic acid export membrane protein